jgi:ribulose-phosphate 3-epimerase
MIERPADQIAEFARAGADCITIHFEADAHVHRTLGAIREAGCLAGLALNPGTPADSVTELNSSADVVLCMSVNPGWGGQPFIASAPDKVARLRSLAPGAAIEVDGGVDAATVSGVAAAGATLFVAGSAVFGDPEPAEAYRRIVAAAGAE